jgi:hypothetical protein
MSLNTSIDAGDRSQRIRTIQQKLNDKHAEVLGRIRDAGMADDMARQAAVKRLAGVRGLYARFGLTPPQLRPDLQGEVESLPV